MKFFDKDPLEETFMRLDENKLYEVVTKEVMQEQIFSYGIWGRAFADVEGDMQKAKALYIKYRVQDLKDLQIAALANAERARDENEDSYGANIELLPLSNDEIKEAQSMINQILELEIGEDLQEELEEYKVDIAEDEFTKMDLKYLRDLHKRMT